MPNLKEVKSRIKSVKSTQQITKAMKMVAASKLRKAQDSILQMRPYAEKLYGILENVAQSAEGSASSVYAEHRTANKVLLVVISSDKGLCGAFNANAFKTAIKQIEDHYQVQKQEGNLWILPIGKKSFEYFKKRKYQLIPDFWEMFHQLSFDKVREAAEFVMSGFVKGDFDKVDLIYNEFKNVATQIQRADNFLPIEANEDDKEENAQPQNNVDYIIEPSVDYIIKELIPQTLKIQFYKAILESNASEHGARMTAMDKATENAGELLKDLTLMYNRTRQAAITKEILEIVGGAEALSNQ